jgi:2-methylisocitrate lyase-like PEP mutase family enzyme
VRHKYGNAINVKRTVAGYAAAGFAGIMIEDHDIRFREPTHSGDRIIRPPTVK